jgi:hypothetical protein
MPALPSTLLQICLGGLMPSPAMNMTEWDRTIATLSSRAESLLDATISFAPTVFLSALHASQDQVIYGRRGTGKTHMLRRLQSDYLPSEFGRHRSIVSRVDASELTTAAYGTDPAPEIVAIDIYGQMIKRVAADLRSFLSDKLEPNLIERALGTGRARRPILLANRRSLLANS